MAKENIAKFFNAAMSDKALAENLATLATENGFEFTAEELLELGSSRPLSDDEVADAAGGWSIWDRVFGGPSMPRFI